MATPLAIITLAIVRTDRTEPLTRLHQTEQRVEEHLERFMRHNEFLTERWNRVVEKVRIRIDRLVDRTGHGETGD